MPFSWVMLAFSMYNMWLKVRIRPCSSLFFVTQFTPMPLYGAQNGGWQGFSFAVNCYEAVAWEPNRTVIHHSTLIMGSSFLLFSLYRFNGTKLLIILPLLRSASYLPCLKMDAIQQIPKLSQALRQNNNAGWKFITSFVFTYWSK